MNQKITQEEAVDLVAARAGMPAKDFIAREITGFPEFYHVEHYVRRSGDDKTSGSVYIVDRESGVVHQEEGGSSVYASCARVWSKGRGGGR